MRRVLAVAALVGIGLTLSNCTSPSAPPPPPPDAPIATRSLLPGVATGPVAVPEHGVLIGAWVRPDSYTQTGRQAAIEDFSRRLGRRLDLINTYRRVHEPIGTASDLAFIQAGSTLMISWTGADTLDMLAGKYDDEIRAHARQARDLKVPVMLRLRWEMDRPNLAASVGAPESFADAWRYVRRVFAQEGATNVAWVWCPTVEGFQRGNAPLFYPGDDVVDWTCVDAYAGSSLTPMGELLQPFLQWAAQHPKPIVIGEFGVARAYSSAQRATWLREAGVVFAANPQIKAVLYFESDPDDRTEAGKFALSDDAPAFAALSETLRSLAPQVPASP